MKHITINGRFVTQRATGVQRVQRECVRAIDRLVGEGAFAGVSIRVAVPKSDNDAHLSLGLSKLPIDVVSGGSGHRWEQLSLARHAAHTTIVCLGNTAPLASLFQSEGVAVMIHDLAYRYFVDDYSLSYRVSHQVADTFILRAARPVLTVSHTEAANLRRFVGRGTKVVVAPNGSCVDDVMPDLKPRAPGGPLLSVGAFSERKNITAVVAAAIDVATRKGLGTVLVGPEGEASARLKSAIPPPLRDLIQFRGFVDEAELAHLYRTATALLYPSSYEASGLPPTEAMSYGCPVLASNIPVLHERCGEAAVFCDPTNISSVIASANQLVDDADLRARLAIAGPARARQFTWRRQAEIVIGAALAG